MSSRWLALSLLICANAAAAADLRNEAIGIRPQFGALIYNEPTIGEATARGVLGISADFNISRYLGGNLHLAISSGAIASHLGASSSNFFGTTPELKLTDPGANLLVVPLNLKLGWHFSEDFRVSARAGFNLVYRSVTSAMDLGIGTFFPGDDWSLYPNIGVDIEAGLSQRVTLILRPDFTFTPGDDFLIGTLGIGFSLG